MGKYITKTSRREPTLALAMEESLFAFQAKSPALEALFQFPPTITKRQPTPHLSRYIHAGAYAPPIPLYGRNRRREPTKAVTWDETYDASHTKVPAIDP